MRCSRARRLIAPQNARLDVQSRLWDRLGRGERRGKNSAPEGKGKAKLNSFLSNEASDVIQVSTRLRLALVKSLISAAATSSPSPSDEASECVFLS